ncbi:MAG: response regulator transcription factor [Chryseotalea sp. WA131a]|jgi:DNA-binding NarL/FixJ family response regulator|nr:MAG: response regulator transcription factor [Chryseotalea sp. WA131a]
MSKIKIGLVDDNKQFRRSLKLLFKIEHDFEIMLEADNGLHLLEQLGINVEQPEIILMDIRMPKMDGIEASKKVLENYPQIKIITFSQYDYESNIVQMYIIGVKSFIGKDDHPNELIKAIRTVYTSGSYMTDMATEIIQRYLAYKVKESNNVHLLDNEQEKELIKMIVKGLSSGEIASKIYKSPRTVDDMRKRLYSKFNIDCKEQLIALASKWNLE